MSHSAPKSNNFFKAVTLMLTKQVYQKRFFRGKQRKMNNVTISNGSGIDHGSGVGSLIGEVFRAVVARVRGIPLTPAEGRFVRENFEMADEEWVNPYDPVSRADFVKSMRGAIDFAVSQGIFGRTPVQTPQGSVELKSYLAEALDRIQQSLDPAVGNKASLAPDRIQALEEELQRMLEPDSDYMEPVREFGEVLQQKGCPARASILPVTLLQFYREAGDVVTKAAAMDDELANIDPGIYKDSRRELQGKLAGILATISQGRR